MSLENVCLLTFSNKLLVEEATAAVAAAAAAAAAAATLTELRKDVGGLMDAGKMC